MNHFKKQSFRPLIIGIETSYAANTAADLLYFRGIACLRNFMFYRVQLYDGIGRQ